MAPYRSRSASPPTKLSAMVGALRRFLVEVDDAGLQSVIAQIKSAYDEAFTPQLAHSLLSQLYVCHTAPRVAWVG
ncbi:MAG: hypothetical protein HC810_04515 [Acaryochloridaceae cyanobacterium RL_2_7]|nr:hypothetical protein [Acaryochloridaceae cyanobacterium RL_2_7]